MASTEAAQLPSASVRQSAFEQGVAYALHLWPALSLSVQNNWGGPDSSDKRDWFAGAVVDLFPPFTDTPAPATTSTTKSTAVAEEPDLEEIETVLLQVMVDEFEVNVDDESGAETAEQIFKARSECAEGNFETVNTLKTRFLSKGTKKVDAMFKQIEADDQDTDWESDDSGDDDNEGGADVEMGEAPAPREKPQPEIDEDGFTKVTRKK
ncbi:hypothetical protein CC79DRAFT_1326022 [Sarocladium strictum]